jgi:hypothetical protein
MRRPLALLALVALLLILFFWLRHRPPKTVAQAPPPRSEAPVAVPRWVIPAPPGVARLEVHRKPNVEHYGLWMLADPNLPMIVADSLLVSRFPRDSFPLTKYQLDQLQPNRRFDSRGPVTHLDNTVVPDMQVLFTGDKFRLVGDETLLMTLELFKDNRAVPVSISSATVRAIGVDGAGAAGLEMPISFSDRDDLVKMATLKLSGTPLEKHGGRVFVDVRYDPGDGNLAQATLDLLYQPGGPPPARFNGTFRESMQNGSLEIYAGVDVNEAGPYMIQANLLDANGAPAVSMVARMVQLDADATEVRLEAFGRVVREQESPSPFTLTNLRGYLFYPGGEPDRKTMPDYTDDYRTAKYPIDAFSDEEYWDEHKQTQITNLLQFAHSAPPGTQPTVTISTATSQGWNPPW